MSGSHEVARFDVAHHTFQVVDATAAGSLSGPAVVGHAGTVARTYHIADIDIGSGPGQPPIRVTIMAEGARSPSIAVPGAWLEPDAAAQRIGEAVLDLERTSAQAPAAIEIEFQGATMIDATDGAFIAQVAEGLDRDIDVVIPDELAGG